MQNYERQLALEFQLRERRDKMLNDISEGRDEYGGSGPTLKLGKKNSSKKDEGGIGGFLSGLKQGFLNR